MPVRREIAEPRREIAEPRREIADEGSLCSLRRTR
jgi:hypothetical protein